MTTAPTPESGCASTRKSGAQPILFYNRYSGAVEEENVYGEAWLRLTYSNPLGKLALHTLVKRALFSHWCGSRMNTPASRKKIQPFIEKYGIPTEEIADPLDNFPHFNAFFARKLTPEARPIAEADDAVVFPADARHMLIPNIAEAKDLYIKGQTFDLPALLQHAELSERFSEGAALISRLCPVDYHRFHFPLAGTPSHSTRLPGFYYSVNPVALKSVPGVLWKNVRTLCLLDTPQCGEVILLEVGATCVGSIVQTYRANQPIAKGAEKGYFLFGGSTTITLFQKNRIRFAEDLIHASAQGQELYAHMGDTLGNVV